MSSVIYLLRHAEIERTSPRRFLGQSDLPLNDHLPLTPAELVDRLPRQDARLLSEVTAELAALELLHISATTGQLLPAGLANQIGPQLIIEGMLAGAQPPRS